MEYRPDIDGLRAVAVLSVIGFHAGGTLFPGGYVGVDIFFVISGFLITSIIARQLHLGRFSFWDFYARRCKRIFPALIIVLGAVFAYGWVFLLPDEYERLGKHTAAGAGFISNFVFWAESGYFDKAAEAKPLLHLWSLGIEEQFYLLWPPLLVWAWRRKWDPFTIAVAIVGASFALNIMLVSLWQDSGMYYLPPARFWELLLGGAFAYVHLFRKQDLENVLKRLRAVLPRSSVISLENIQATTGLVLIVVAVAVLNKGTLFPGWWGLLPTMGALLLISAGPAAWINRKLLGSSAFVWIGLISYPLYLWHWPVLSYVQIVGDGTPSQTTKAAAVALAFLLAWLTYQIIEKPVRRQSNEAAWVLIASLIVVAGIGLASFSHQLHARSEKYGIDRIVKATSERGYPGRLKSSHTADGYHFEQGVGSPKVLFVGDSNMEQYYPRIDKLLTEQPQETRGVLFVTQPGCLPIPYMKGFAQTKCAGLAERGWALAEHADVDRVVIAAGWSGYDVFDSSDSERAFASLTSTVANYRRGGRQVYLILPIPVGTGFDPSRLVARSLLDFGFKIVDRPVERVKVDAEIKPMASRLTEIAQATGAEVIDPVNYLCGNGNCPTFTGDGMPIYMDAGHLRPGYVRDHVTFLDAIVSN
jgi:peptidoglycan/LPS O-acetylase OafA/YrhL